MHFGCVRLFWSAPTSEERLTRGCPETVAVDRSSDPRFNLDWDVI